MDRRGKRVSSGISHLVESEAASSELSGVARGSERQSNGAAARGDKRTDDLAACSRNGAHYSSLCADSGSEAGNSHFPDSRANTPCALKRRWVTAPFRQSLSETADSGGWPYPLCFL